MVDSLLESTFDGDFEPLTDVFIVSALFLLASRARRVSYKLRFTAVPWPHHPQSQCRYYFIRMCRWSRTEKYYSSHVLSSMHANAIPNRVLVLPDLSIIVFFSGVGFSISHRRLQVQRNRVFPGKDQAIRGAWEWCGFWRRVAIWQLDFLRLRRWIEVRTALCLWLLDEAAVSFSAILADLTVGSSVIVNVTGSSLHGGRCTVQYFSVRKDLNYKEHVGDMEVDNLWIGCRSCSPLFCTCWATWPPLFFMVFSCTLHSMWWNQLLKHWRSSSPLSSRWPWTRRTRLQKQEVKACDQCLLSDPLNLSKHLRKKLHSTLMFWRFATNKVYKKIPVTREKVLFHLRGEYFANCQLLLCWLKCSSRVVRTIRSTMSCRAYPWLDDSTLSICRRSRSQVSNPLKFFLNNLFPAMKRSEAASV